MTTKPILLIEDNEVDEVLTLRAIEMNHISNPVIVARDGEEAMNLLFKHGVGGLGAPVRPSVILLDLRLPKISGFDVLRSIRTNEDTKLFPVIIMTSSKEDRDVVEGYRLGANSYVRKPIKFEELVHAVNHLGMFWLLLNEHPDRDDQQTA